MDTTPSNGAAPFCLLLDADLGIESVALLYEELKLVVDAGAAVCLDGSAVESIDTASLQLLTVFSLELQAQGINLNWHQPSDSLCHAATITGLFDVLLLKQAA